MAYAATSVENGKDQIAYARQRDHWTLWGCDICIHLYEDGCTLDDKAIQLIAETLEQHTK